MDGEAEAAGEYERLRAELADFLVNALAERMAAGEQPELSRALAEAIDRRVDQAVSARLASVEWPDPDAFADSVIAAAAGRGGVSSAAGSEGARPRSRRADEDGGDRHRPQPTRERNMNAGKIGLIALVALALVAAAAYFLLRNSPTGATNTVVMNVQTNSIEPTPDGSGALQTGNAAAPTSAGADQNVQGPTP
jgi:hypothetical protein